MGNTGTLRIIGGKLRGRRLRTVDSPTTRPMTDRVRESLFNILEPEIKDASILDLFAGSGAVGIEGYSRGAATAVFVESNKACAEVINENIQTLGLQSATLLMSLDAYQAVKILGRSGRRFGIVFAGPPYDSNHHNRILKAIIEHCVCEDGGTIVIQYRAGDPFSEPENYSVDTRKYGITCLSFLRRKDD